MGWKGEESRRVVGSRVGGAIPRGQHGMLGLQESERGAGMAGSKGGDWEAKEQEPRNRASGCGNAQHRQKRGGSHRQNHTAGKSRREVLNHAGSMRGVLLYGGA